MKPFPPASRRPRNKPGQRAALTAAPREASIRRRRKDVPKKIPMRQCVGCREMKPKKELIRVVKSPEGEVSLDFKGKKPGRGAYVCPNPECLKKARKARALERAFSAPMPDGVYDALEEQMKEGGDG